MTPEQLLAMLVEQMSILINKVQALEAKLANPVPVDIPVLNNPVKVGVPTLVPFVKGAQPKWIVDANGDTICAEDFWMENQVSCQKGAYQVHYSSAGMILVLMGGDFPKHMNVIVRTDKGHPWSNSVKRAGDIGWLPGNEYFHDPNKSPQENYANWLSKGAPIKDGAGNPLGSRGDKLSASEWEDAAKRLQG